MKVKLMCKHMQLVHAGKFAVARGILKLLTDGIITLYFDDVSMEIDAVLEKYNVKSSTNRRGVITYRLKS